MTNLTGCVSTFDNLNTRIDVAIGFMDLRTYSIRNIAKQIKDFIKSDELVPALHDFFVSRNETALQIKYARGLVDNNLKNWLSTHKGITEKMSYLQNLIYMPDTGESRPDNELEPV